MKSDKYRKAWFITSSIIFGMGVGMLIFVWSVFLATVAWGGLQSTLQSCPLWAVLSATGLGILFILAGRSTMKRTRKMETREVQV